MENKADQRRACSGLLIDNSLIICNKTIVLVKSLVMAASLRWLYHQTKRTDSQFLHLSILSLFLFVPLEEII